MAYVKQNFKSGETLYALQLNAMDGQIAANEAAIKENKRAIEALPSGGGTTLTGAQAATLDAGSAATAEIVDTVDGKVLKIGVPRGEKGDAGAKGDPGERGIQGERGLPGEKGDTGAMGAQGEKGDKGEPGAAGAQGEKGDKGDTGATGPAGPQGPKGEKGDKGDTGPQGAQANVDTTLAVSGAAADAAAVGDAVQGLQAAHGNLVEEVAKLGLSVADGKLCVRVERSDNE